MDVRVLDERRAEALARLCEWIVPGSARVGPVVYVDAIISAMARDERVAALEAIDTLATAGSIDALSAQRGTPEFALVRALAIEAYYSDFVAPDEAGPGAWKEIEFEPPLAADLDRDWSYLGIK